MVGKTFQPDKTALDILRASLPHIPFEGWGKKALLAGAADCGYDAESVHLAFPLGAVDAIALHSRVADETMVEAFWLFQNGQIKCI